MTPPSSNALSQQRRHERSRAIAQTVVSAFTERLKEEAQKQGGYLSQRHIDELNTDFQAKADQLTTVFEKAFEEAAREQEELKWHAIKRPAFDRLIVKRFEHLFIHKESDGIAHGNISRRFLPGFFLALNMMLGPEVLERYQWRCDMAMDRVMKNKTPVDWQRVDADPDVHDIMLDAQFAIAMHFEDASKRSDWFLHIVNTHLAPPVHKDAPDAQWELGSRALHILVNSLLSDLKKAAGDTIAWQHLTERHPSADHDKICAILERLTMST